MRFCLAQTQRSVITLLGSLVLYCAEHSRRNLSATAEHQSRTSWIREYGTRTDLSSHLTLSVRIQLYSSQGKKAPKALSVVPLLIKVPLLHISEVRSPGAPIQSRISGCNNCSRRNILNLLDVLVYDDQEIVIHNSQGQLEPEPTIFFK